MHRTNAWMMGLLLAVACGGDKDDDGGDAPADTDVDTDSDADADGDTDADADADADADTDADTDTETGDTGPAVDPWCVADPQVTSLVATAGLTVTNVQLDVVLDAPAPIVTRCVVDSDPTVIFFKESVEELDTHTIRMSGLLPNETYTCTAAPVCPGRTAGPADVSHTVGVPPSDMRRLDTVIDKKLGMTGAWTMAPFTLNAFGGTSWIVVWDNEGRVRWYHRLPGGVTIDYEALYDVDLDEVVWGGGEAPEGHLRIVNLWNEELFAYEPVGWQSIRYHHDAKRLDDGRLATLEWRDNSSGSDTWDGYAIQVFDQATGIVELEVSSQRYYDEGTLPPASSVFDNDPYHANWMDLKDDGAGGTTLYISHCFDESIMALDGVTGDLEWILGAGRGWTVLDPTGKMLPQTALPQCQHGLEVLAPNHLLVYDNGTGRGQSIASEWVVDPTLMTAQQLWSWTEPGWNEPALGDIDLLDGDRVLLTMATFFGSNEIVEVDRATGLVAARQTLTGGITYRSERYDGCELFDDTTVCDTLADRHDEVVDLLTP